MKNKKLFAILTLVCFMFTLMPVAAFADDTIYAEVNDDYELVKLVEGKADVKLDLTNAPEGTYVAYAYKDGSFYKKLGTKGFATLTLTADKEDKAVKHATIELKDAGDYEIFVANAAVATGDTLTNAEKVALLNDKSTVVMLSNAVTVKGATSTYAIEVLSGKTVSLDANAGFDTEDVRVKLTANGSAVVGQELAISTNSSAVDTDKTVVKTNAAGIAEFKVSASTAGTYEVYVEYGSKADATIVVSASALEAAAIKTVEEPTSPVNLGMVMANASAKAVGIFFEVTDANGNVIEGVANGDALADVTTTRSDILVTEKPAGSSINDKLLDLEWIEAKGYWAITGDSLDEEGTYTFKVALENGAYATASVEVKEFQKPVALSLTYEQNAVELGGKAILKGLVYVDANGVVKQATDAKLSATGYAIESFDAATGEVLVKENEKYVGSEIKVIAVSEKYDLVSTVVLTVANEAAAVKYDTTTAEVASNSTLFANVVDVDGKKVALSTTAGTYAIQYIVLDKPENAKVAVSTIGGLDVKTGAFKVSFTASTAGEYELQTIVRYNQEDGVVKYYTGIETITVGNTGIKDVVVMSVGSNEIVVNSEIKAIDAAPIVENNRTFVPFRALAEAFGAEVAYDEATQAVTAELNGTTVVMTIGSAEYTVNGVAKTADVAPFINGSRTMVPVRFVAEAFGINVTPTYNDNGTTADILFAK